jgi:chromosome segregation ATPase
MTDFQETRLTEVDKLLRKIDLIYTAIKGKDPDAVDLTKVTDEFEKLRYEINQKLSEVETFLSKKEEYKGNDPRDVFEKSKVSAKVEDGLKEIEEKLAKSIIVLRAQKGKPKKFGDITTKEKAKELMDERFQMLRNRHEGLFVDDKKIDENKTSLEKLDHILLERANRPDNNREPNEHELQAMQKWKDEIDDQDKDLAELGAGVKTLKVHSKKIGNKIEESGKHIKKVQKVAEATSEKLKTSNAKLKELLDKIRTGDRFCVDLLLILICLGLIAVLYNVIKSKFFSTTAATTTTTPTTPAKTFLYI